VKARSAVAGLQYHLPFDDGRRVWVSALGSLTRSDNAVEVISIQSIPFVWNRAWYYDLNVFVAMTRALQLAASYQLTHQTFGDGVSASNARAQLAATYFF
jgi:hypothetical protein